MAVAFDEKTAGSRGLAAPLPLESGDRLHSREFLRRFESMLELKKAELVEGIVVMGSPVSHIHAKPDGIIHYWLAHYAAQTPDVECLPNVTVILDPENTVQPDALLRILPSKGGKTTINEKGYLVGPPELIVEIAASSVSIDSHDKLRAYCRNRVPEYLIWLVSERRLKWFVLEDDTYIEISPDAQGMLRSRICPGLVLPIEGALRCDAAAVVGVPQASK